jgi:hypothetical protein
MIGKSAFPEVQIPGLSVKQYMPKECAQATTCASTLPFCKIPFTNPLIPSSLQQTKNFSGTSSLVQRKSKGHRAESPNNFFFRRGEA